MHVNYMFMKDILAEHCAIVKKSDFTTVLNKVQEIIKSEGKLESYNHYINADRLEYSVIDAIINNVPDKIIVRQITKYKTVVFSANNANCHYNYKVVHGEVKSNMDYDYMYLYEFNSKFNCEKQIKFTFEQMLLFKLLQNYHEFTMNYEGGIKVSLYLGSDSDHEIICDREDTGDCIFNSYRFDFTTREELIQFYKLVENQPQIAVVSSESYHYNNWREVFWHELMGNESSSCHIDCDLRKMLIDMMTAYDESKKITNKWENDQIIYKIVGMVFNGAEIFESEDLIED